MLKLDVFKRFLLGNSACTVLCDRAANLNGIEFDSRKVKAGQAFLALAGEKSDGHLYLDQAYQKGARIFIVSQSQQDKSVGVVKMSDTTVVAVPDPLEFFQTLANFERQTWNFPVLAIAGSNGKTTTKNFCLQLFSHFLITGGTHKNFNNHLGVPYSILNLIDQAQVGVFELGMNHPGEIKFLCQILQPTLGGVVSVGEEHLEFFKDLNEVAASEFELYDYLIENKGSLIRNQQVDYWVQYQKSEHGQMLTNQMGAGPAQFHYSTLGAPPSLTQVNQQNWLGIVRLKNLESNLSGGQMFCRVYREQSRDFVAPFSGEYNLSNLAFALSALSALGIDPISACSKVASLTLPEFRNQIESFKNNNYLLDCYNANPSSVSLGVINFVENFSDANKVLILGDMFELGTQSAAKHLEILQFVLAHISHFKWVLCVGNNFEKACLSISLPPNLVNLSNAQQAHDWIESQKIKGFTFFIKGSRGMALERIIEKNYH